MSYWRTLIRTLNEDEVFDLTRGNKLEVRFEGEEFKTDGTTVWFPKDVPRHVADEVIAAAMHEVGHIRHSDFKVLERLYGVRPHVAPLLNVLEDIRIDTGVFVKYRSASFFYRALMSYIDKKAAKHPEALAKLEPQARVVLELIYQAYPAGVKATPHGFACDQGTVDWFAKNADYVEELTDLCKDPSTTTDMLATAAVELFKRLYGNDPPKRPAQQQHTKCTCAHCHNRGFPEDIWAKGHVFVPATVKSESTEKPKEA